MTDEGGTVAVVTPMWLLKVAAPPLPLQAPLLEDPLTAEALLRGWASQRSGRAPVSTKSGAELPQEGMPGNSPLAPCVGKLLSELRALVFLYRFLYC